MILMNLNNVVRDCFKSMNLRFKKNRKGRILIFLFLKVANTTLIIGQLSLLVKDVFSEKNEFEAIQDEQVRRKNTEKAALVGKAL